MEANIFVRKLNSVSYTPAGAIKFSSLPRIEEFISLQFEGSKKYFQVIAIHHSTSPDHKIEIYSLQTEPTWEMKKSGNIGFNF